uniref:hypothetical protein n=1 Tax=Nonomuraea sp. CA-252377 TaxID=3240003 RepID=UPI003F495659
MPALHRGRGPDRITLARGTVGPSRDRIRGVVAPSGTTVDYTTTARNQGGCCSCALRRAGHHRGPGHGHKKDADAQIRLLLAYGRAYVTPHTLETLGQAADLSPSGASRAFEADEIVEVGDRTGLRAPAAKIEDYDPRDPRLGQASRTRCTWGGGDRNNPCPEDPKYTVTDKSGTRWSCCKGHLPATSLLGPRAESLPGWQRWSGGSATGGGRRVRPRWRPLLGTRRPAIHPRTWQTRPHSPR